MNHGEWQVERTCGGREPLAEMEKVRSGEGVKWGVCEMGMGSCEMGSGEGVKWERTCGGRGVA